MVSMLVLLPSLYLLVSQKAWQMVKESCHDWLEKNHWDVKVTQVVWQAFGWVDQNHRVILSGVIGCSMVHNLFSLVLILGAILYKRSLFLPWMVSEMFIIILMVLTFTCWTFMSFFVDLLVAIVFPVIAGLVLGFWIYLWRRVRTIFIILGRRKEEKIILRQQISVRKSSGGDDLLDQKVRRPHRQLIVNAENDMLY